MQAKKILLFGSGLVSKPVLIYFSKHKGYHVTVLTNDQQSGKELTADFPGSSSLVIANVEDQSACLSLVEAHDVVLSLLPANLHPLVAGYCLKAGRHMLTSSYLNPEIQKLEPEVLAKRLTFLNEVGLDPGIDHIVTLKMIGEVRKRGGKVESLYSLCGGLVSPDCLDNPLCYKFSWSPLGVFRALGNDARFLRDGKVVEIAGENLLYSAENFSVNNALNIVKYPNRDSLKYAALYQIPEAKNLYRGTLRYKGFCEIVSGFKELGFLREEKPEKEGLSWPSIIKTAIENQKSSSLSFDVSEILAALDSNLLEKCGEIDREKLINKLTFNSIWKSFSRETIVSRLNMILEALDFFGFLNNKAKVQSSKTYLQNFIDQITPSMTLKNSDSDSVIMALIIDAHFPQNKIKERLKFQMILNGEKGGLSAMSKTVGFPLAVAAKLVVDGKISRRGVMGPFTEDVYGPIYEELVKMKLIPEYFVRKFEPKL